MQSKVFQPIKHESFLETFIETNWKWKLLSKELSFVFEKVLKWSRVFKSVHELKSSHTAASDSINEAVKFHEIQLNFKFWMKIYFGMENVIFGIFGNLDGNCKSCNGFEISKQFF